MSHYRSNLRDIEFNLFEYLKTDEYYGDAPFETFDKDTAMDALREVERLSVEDFAASFVDADRIELEIVDGEVKLPESVKASLDALFDGGWHLLGVESELGGFGAPDSLRWASGEMFMGSNPAVFLYASGALMARVIAGVGTDDQIQKWAIPMVERGWGATMALTEPDAGSDVGAGTTKAVHIEGDAWHLDGVKRFITSGENDYYENIIHLVLARREGGPPGTKGLSMFIVPKYFLNDDGSLGARNGVYATGLEHKMGIKGSTTTELSLGHRGRQDVDRRQVRSDTFDRLPQLTRLRQGACSVGRSCALDGQDGSACRDHQTPRRPPHAHAPEVVRRGSPCTVDVHVMDP
jgi:alkylation response protein AidB-like acyl-CoA dehydrogenase